MGRTYANRLNAYVLVVTYISSHRAGKKVLSLPHDGFMIHRFCPAFSTENSDGKIISLDLSKHRPQSKMPIIPADILDDMKKFWASLRKYVKNEKFWKEEGEYGQYYDGRMNYWRTGLRLGKEFVSKGGSFCLENIFKKYHYEAGKYYSCEEFVSRLKYEIGVDVKVTFRTSDEGFRYLNEIHVLYDTSDQHNMVSYLPEKLDYESGEMFYLEDLESRFGPKKNGSEIVDSTNEETENEVMEETSDQKRDEVEVVTHKKKRGHRKGMGKGMFGIFRKYKLCLGK